MGKGFGLPSCPAARTPPEDAARCSPVVRRGGHTRTGGATTRESSARQALAVAPTETVGATPPQPAAAGRELTLAHPPRPPLPPPPSPTLTGVRPAGGGRVIHGALQSSRRQAGSDRLDGLARLGRAKRRLLVEVRGAEAKDQAGDACRAARTRNDTRGAWREDETTTTVVKRLSGAPARRKRAGWVVGAAGGGDDGTRSMGGTACSSADRSIRPIRGVFDSIDRTRTGCVRVLVPDEKVDAHGGNLARVANDGEGGRRDEHARLRRRRRFETHARVAPGAGFP